MKAPVAALKAARESRPGGRINLQESQSTTAATRQIRLLHASKNLQQVRGLGVLHGRLMYSTSKVLSVTTGHLCMLGGVFGAWFIGNLGLPVTVGLVGAVVVGALF